MKHILNFSVFEQIQGTTSNYGFVDQLIDTFIPGTPVKDGRDLISKFDAIIKRRIDYNKKHNLPIDTLTPEEKTFREKILKATPSANAPYPNIFELSKIIQDINQGKNIQSDELEKYEKNTRNGTVSNIRIDISSGNELKKMWLGIDEPGGENKGFWVKSEFRPKDSTDPNAVYYKPKEIPKLTLQQFDELYGEIMKTRSKNGKFPGGNSEIIYKQKLNYVPKSFLDVLESDLGHFKFGAGQENGKKYISIYDEWDLMPPSLKEFGVDIQKYGKTPLIYYRIYRP